MARKEISMVNGYRMVYLPDHPEAVRSGAMKGYVYEHRLVAEQFMGRPLSDDEDVHHLDGNRANNLNRNLLVLETGQHLKLHTWLKQNTITPIPGSKVDREQEVKYCKCGTQISNDAEYCSAECTKSDKKVIPPITSEELDKLIWSKPTTKVAKDLNVSDTAVAKLCKKLGVQKPPRGFWQMLEADKICIIPQD